MGLPLDVERFLAAVKGQLFVLVTAAILFLLVMRQLTRLFESEARYRRLVEGSPDVIYSVSHSRGGLYYSPRAEAMLGFSPQYLGEHPHLWIDRVHPDERPGLQAAIARTIEGTPLDIEYRFQTASGQWKWLHDRSVGTIQAGGDLIIEGVVTDITERRAIERQVQHQRQLIDALMRGTTDAIFVKDLEGRYLLANAAVEASAGRPIDQILGHVDEELYSARDAETMRAADRAVLADDRVGTFEDHVRLPDGSTAAYLVTKGPIRDTDGRPYGVFGVSRDITERVRAEDQIRKLNADLEERVARRTVELEQANRELEAFSYSVSHDLRAPLRHIAGYVDLLESRVRDELSEQGRHYLDAIAQSSQEMGQLIDDLLAFSRTSRAEMRRTVIDTDSLVEGVIGSLGAVCEGRAVEWDVGSLPKSWADGSLLQQVWANLLENAVKYTRGRDVARISVRGEVRDGMTVYSVSDNGAGFDMRYAGKLFGVFQRLHTAAQFEGTGVGLANVKRIVDRHGGEVWAEAEPEKGATFHFSLPLREER